MHKISKNRSPNSNAVAFSPLLVALLAFVLLFSCVSKPKDLSEQLKAHLLTRMEIIDSTLALDSFIVLRTDTITRRIVRIIDDSIYMREFVRVKTQLSNAMKQSRKDSIDFYQDEVNYMLTQVDSLNKAVSEADTTMKLGLVSSYKIQLSKGNAKQEGIVYYFLDRSMMVRDTEMIDSTIAQMSRNLH